VLALAVEDLHAVQSAVDHDDAAVRKGPDRVRPAELTVARPWLPQVAIRVPAASKRWTRLAA